MSEASPPKEGIPARLYETIANYTYDWESWLSPEGRPLWINPAVERMTGYGVAECLAMADYPMPLALPEDRAKLAGHLATAGAGQSGNDVEFRILRRDGGIVWAAMSWQSLYDQAGAWLGFRTSVRDISRRKEAERQREALRRAAEEANLAKSQFLAAASHDLRQPIQAAALFVAALKNETGEGPAAALVEQLRLCLASSQELLDALLDISRLDAQVMKAEPRELALSDLFERVEAEFAEPAAEKGLNLRCIASSHFVLSDPVLLYRIVQNLVANAVRYTRSGGVVVGARRRGNRVAVQVSDSGIGIAADDIPTIFREFHQLANSERDRAKGLGLGLAIVDRLAKLLGAEVIVRSTPGRGSSFSILLPLAAQATAAPPPAEPQPKQRLSGRTIAVLDDNHLVLTALCRFVEMEGAATIGAGSVDQLERRLRQSETQPDLLLVDYRLRDGHDGAAAIGRLRRLLGRRVPAVLLTGDTLPERLQEAEATGLELLHKPIRPQHLVGTIARMLTAPPEG